MACSTGRPQVLLHCERLEDRSVLTFLGGLGPPGAVGGSPPGSFVHWLDSADFEAALAALAANGPLWPGDGAPDEGDGGAIDWLDSFLNDQFTDDGAFPLDEWDLGTGSGDETGFVDEPAPAVEDSASSEPVSANELPSAGEQANGEVVPPPGEEPPQNEPGNEIDGTASAPPVAEKPAAEPPVTDRLPDDLLQVTSGIPVTDTPNVPELPAPVVAEPIAVTAGPLGPPDTGPINTGPLPTALPTAPSTTTTATPSDRPAAPVFAFPPPITTNEPGRLPATVAALPTNSGTAPPPQAPADAQQPTDGDSAVQASAPSESPTDPNDHLADPGSLDLTDDLPIN